jgi:hypothetical protein
MSGAALAVQLAAERQRLEAGNDRYEQAEAGQQAKARDDIELELLPRGLSAFADESAAR